MKKREIASDAPKEVDTVEVARLPDATEVDLGVFDPSSVAELNFEEIDWSYWEGLDLASIM